MTDTHGVARDQLRAFIERIERLSEEAKTIADDIRDVKSEAKSMGFSVKAINEIIKLRKKDENERAEEEAILDTYKAALGMIPQIELFGEAHEPVSREDRRKRVMSESMDDHKALIDEMADAGLISEDARAENKALADAVATKFGDGPVSAKPLQSPRKAAEAVSERTANDPNDGTAGSGMAKTEATAVTVGETTGEAVSADLSTNSEIDIPSDESEPTGNEAGETSADANTGGGHVDDTQNAATHQAGVLVVKSPAAILRPDCLRPENCAGHGSTLCHACRKEAQGRVAA